MRKADKNWITPGSGWLYRFHRAYIARQGLLSLLSNDMRIDLKIGPRELQKLVHDTKDHCPASSKSVPVAAYQELSSRAFLQIFH